MENQEEKRELAPVSQIYNNFPTQAEWNTLNIIATTLKAGGVLPKGIDTVQKMVVILQAGRELNLAPIEALNSLYFVNGKIAMYGEVVPNQVLRAGHIIDWGLCNAETATVTITRGDTGKSMTTTFTMQQARERGYTSNPVYQKYPENMLKWRVLGMTVKFLCPDALRGIGIKEEMEAEVVDVGGRFENKEEGKRVKEEVASDTLSKRKPLDAVIAEADAEEAQTEPAPEKADEGVKEPGIEEEFKCAECGKVMKSQGGLTIHMKTHE